MLRLAMLLYSLAGTTLAGTAVIVALVAGYDDLTGLVTAAAIGALAAMPAAYLIARKLTSGEV